MDESSADETPLGGGRGTPRKRAPGRKLAREIGAVLLFKVLALTGLYIAFFGPAKVPEVSSKHVGEALFTESQPPSRSPLLLPSPGERR